LEECETQLLHYQKLLVASEKKLAEARQEMVMLHQSAEKLKEDENKLQCHSTEAMVRENKKNMKKICNGS